METAVPCRWGGEVYLGSAVELGVWLLSAGSDGTKPQRRQLLSTLPNRHQTTCHAPWDFGSGCILLFSPRHLDGALTLIELPAFQPCRRSEPGRLTSASPQCSLVETRAALCSCYCFANPFSIGHMDTALVAQPGPDRCAGLSKANDPLRVTARPRGIKLFRSAKVPRLSRLKDQNICLLELETATENFMYQQHGRR